MKRSFFLLSLIVSITLIACNNSDKKDTKDIPVNTDIPATPADSLMKDIDDSHMAVMPKMGKLTTLEKKVQEALDSIAKLPAKAQQAAAPYKANLEGVISDLRSAKASMEKWMDEFNMDSAVNNMQERIHYLTDEKLKVSKMKESVLGSLEKADSILKARF